jgi:hypothetical protein
MILMQYDLIYVNNLIFLTGYIKHSVPIPDDSGTFSYIYSIIKKRIGDSL